MKAVVGTREIPTEYAEGLLAYAAGRLSEPVLSEWLTQRLVVDCLLTHDEAAGVVQTVAATRLPSTEAHPRHHLRRRRGAGYGRRIPYPG